MEATEVMRRPVVSVSPSTTVRAANALLVDHGFAALPVVDEDGHVVGVVTGSDLLRASVTGASSRTVVAQVVHAPAITADVTATVVELADAVLRHGLHCLPVVDEAGVLVGVVSRTDLLRTLVPDDDVLASRIDRLLRDHSRAARWRVRVVDGDTTISGPFEDEAERRVVTALAHTVPGITGLVLRDPLDTEDPTTSAAR
ncbi:HPP family protein [Umezawaea sp.]|uniref:CBS domain-containing protein n=1 Tax=Umezawaea sp. TaxID=1955258 RepID=UPI002ED029BF